MPKSLTDVNHWSEMNTVRRVFVRDLT